jgi:hypothetical protein
MTVMKRSVIYFLAILLMVPFFSCEKESGEEPGAIAGMGEASGELAVTPFDLPEGLSLDGDISGVDLNGDDGTAASVEDKNLLKSWHFGNLFPDYGNGGQWIKLKLTISNNHGSPRTLFFPQGLVFKVNNAEYQHGILLQWTWFVVKAHSTRTIYLNLFCVNKGRHGSSSDVQYTMAGITQSALMWKLLNRIGWRKINCEHYFYPKDGLKSAGSLKSEEDLVEHYEEISELLQDAVWSVTNGDGLTAQQIQDIEALPLLEEGTYPEGLEDNGENAPFFFDEYQNLVEN